MTMDRLPAACAALMLAASLAQPASAQDLKPWKHGVIEPKGDAGFMWMVGTRDFAARHGLKLEILSLKNGALAHKALLSGELDSIESSPGAAILAGARGADLKIVGCDWPGVPQGLMVRAGIKKVEDLRGKTIAVAAPGSLPNLVVAAILEKYKVAASEVKFANLGGDNDRFKAVVAGIADAGAVAAEFMSVAPPGIKMLVASHEVLPNYVRLCVTVTGKTLSAKREEVVNFVAAQMDALRYAVAHRAETIKLTKDMIHDKADDPRPAYAFDDALKRGAIDPALTLPLDKLNWMQSELVKAGNLKTPVDLAKITDASVRADAAKRAGH